MTEQPIHWETEGTSRIPFAVYTDEDRHKKELERFFYKNHWSYVAWRPRSPTRVISNARWWASARSS